jgi:metal-dependent amidase/aminoacylase/carboxypeptidase family protein
VLDRRVRELAEGLAALHGATASVEIRWGTTPLVNHPEQTRAAAAAAAALVGADALETDAPPVTGGEDFAFMLEQKPGAFIFIGQGQAADGQAHGLHTPKFDFNDEILPLGAAYWVRLVQNEVGGSGA